MADQTPTPPKTPAEINTIAKKVITDGWIIEEIKTLSEKDQAAVYDKVQTLETPKPETQVTTKTTKGKATYTVPFPLTYDELHSLVTGSKTLADIIKKRQQDLENAAKQITPEKLPATKPAPEPTPAPKQPTVKPELIIPRTPYPKWWKDSLTAKISLTAPGSQTLATVTGRLRLYVATIVITVTGETQITIAFGKYGASGPIYLGGEGQPMGMVIAMGNSPAPCGQGPLLISATDPNDETPSIGGFATCFVEQETT